MYRHEIGWIIIKKSIYHHFLHIPRYPSWILKFWHKTSMIRIFSSKIQAFKLDKFLSIWSPKNFCFARPYSEYSTCLVWNITINPFLHVIIRQASEMKRASVDSGPNFKFHIKFKTYCFTLNELTPKLCNCCLLVTKTGSKNIHTLKVSI